MTPKENGSRNHSYQQVIIEGIYHLRFLQVVLEAGGEDNEHNPNPLNTNIIEK